MDNELFCGLTRREMNVALMTWWIGQSPETRIAEYGWTGLYLTENGKGTQYNEGFDDDLNACAVIEAALDEDQSEAYGDELARLTLDPMRLRYYEHGSVCGDDVAMMATANSQRRSRALLRTLGLGKESDG